MNKLQTVYKIVKPSENINTGITVRYIHNGMKLPVSKTKAYVFTPEELKQLLSDAFDARYNNGFDTANMVEGYSLNYKNKEKYIENLLNKEK